MNDCNINAMDALAIAIENDAKVFVTTDDAILNNGDCISKYGIEVKNPIEVV